MLSSAANAHRSAILTSAVLALPGNGAIMHVVLAVQALAQGLTVPNKVAVSPLQIGTIYSIRCILCELRLLSPHQILDPMWAVP